MFVHFLPGGLTDGVKTDHCNESTPMTGSWFPNGAKINSDFVLTFAVKKEHWFQNINKLAEVIFSDHLERKKKKKAVILKTEAEKWNICPYEQVGVGV